MSVTKHRLSRVAAVALVATVAIGTAACSKDDKPAPGAKPDKLVVETFSQFGYEELAKQYEQQTGIKVEIRGIGSQLGDYTPKLTRELATGKGAGDVVALEEGIISRYSPANFIDLKPYVGDLSSQYLPWKYQLGVAKDGKLFGLPTDVGSLGVCYRRDLFEAAGLPSDRQAVSALWPTWDKFVETAQKYRQATGKALLDSVTTSASAMIFQTGGDIFYDADFNLYNGDAKPENLIAAHSTAVKNAWDLTKKLVEANATAKTATWSSEWSAGFKNGTFAATLCPSWMTGIVQDNSGAENSGKWDLAAVPGGSGSWGGSWLAVPQQTKYPQAAAELAKFLTSASSQVAAFKAKGPLPTAIEALANPDFTGYTNAYFNNAPTGKIFGESVKNIKPLNLGPKHGDVKEKAMEPAMQAFEKGQLSFDAAWAKFLNDVPLQGAF